MSFLIPLPKMQHWFIYYKVPQEHRARVLQCSRELIALIANATGVRGQVTEKLDQSEDQRGSVTLMEIYPDINDADAFALALDSALTHSEIVRVMASIDRRAERFGDCTVEQRSCV